MDPNTQQPIVQQPIVTPVNNQPPIPVSVKKPLNKKLIALLAIIFIVIVAFLYFLIFGRYNFTINNQPVAKSDFQQAYTFYKGESDPKTFNRNDALKATEQFFVENYILKSEYFSKGHTQSDLDAAVSRTDSNSQIPPVLDKISRENNVIKQSLQNSFGIKSVTGEVLRLTVPAGINASTQTILATIMNDRLNFYRTQLAQGTPYSTVKHNFLTDVDFINYPLIMQSVLQFTNMTSEHPIIPQDQFINALFATKANSFSKVINLSKNNSLWYGIGYIQSKNGGTYNSYNDWLAAKRKSVTIKSNFGGIK